MNAGVWMAAVHSPAAKVGRGICAIIPSNLKFSIKPRIYLTLSFKFSGLIGCENITAIFYLIEKCGKNWGVEWQKFLGKKLYWLGGGGRIELYLFQMAPACKNDKYLTSFDEIKAELWNMCLIRARVRMDASSFITSITLFILSSSFFY